MFTGLRIFFLFIIPVFSFAQITTSACDTLEIAVDSAAEANVQISAQTNDPFRHHAQVYEIKKAANQRQPVWLFAVFVFQLALIGYLRIMFPKASGDMFRAAMNLNLAQQLYREQEQSMPISAILYIINFIISGGIFLFLLNRQLGWMQDDTIISMLFFLWAVIVIYSLRYGSMKVVSLIFPFGNVVNHYSFNFFLIQKIMGLLLLPFNLLLAYAPQSLTITVMILALLMVGLFAVGSSLKGLSIARNVIARNAFHFFVYICTLEIAPVCILVKVVVDG